jgi:hypothetical protein
MLSGTDLTRAAVVGVWIEARAVETRLRVTAATAGLLSPPSDSVGDADPCLSAVLSDDGCCGR